MSFQITQSPSRFVSKVFSCEQVEIKTVRFPSHAVIRKNDEFDWLLLFCDCIMRVMEL